MCSKHCSFNSATHNGAITAHGQTVKASRSLRVARSREGGVAIVEWMLLVFGSVFCVVVPFALMQLALVVFKTSQLSLVAAASLKWTVQSTSLNSVPPPAPATSALVYSNLAVPPSQAQQINWYSSKTGWDWTNAAHRASMNLILWYVSKAFSQASSPPPMNDSGDLSSKKFGAFRSVEFTLANDSWSIVNAPARTLVTQVAVRAEPAYVTLLGKMLGLNSAMIVSSYGYVTGGNYAVNLGAATPPPTKKGVAIP
jgi:hypothetical protein